MGAWTLAIFAVATLASLQAEASHRHRVYAPYASFGFSTAYPLGYYGPHYSPWYGPRFGVGIHLRNLYPARRVRTERVERGEQRALKLYVYPAGGQSEAQTSEDRYQCHAWAAERSGHDPTLGAGSRDDAESYSRAFTACMEGRDYVVR